MGNVCSCYEGDEGEASYGINNMAKRHGSTAAIMKKRSTQQFNDMCDKLNRQGQIFVDYDYPATLDSIQGTSKDPSKMDDILRFCNEWRRATDFPSARSNTPELFKGGIDPNDIKQGMLGDCYFVAALATLAEWEKRVKKIYVSAKVNQAQVFGVNLYKDGIFQTVWVDNYFPVFNEAVDSVRKANGEELGKVGEPLFAAAYGNELWVAVAEKAYAKAHGGYVIIAGGSCGPTLRDLCGAPAYTYTFEAGEEIPGLWEKILEGENMNYGMSAGSPGLDEGAYNDHGIVPGHAYSLLAGRTINDKNGYRVNLVKLRNPWKEGEWNGRFSDSSDDWTPQLMNELQHTNANDGIFWMTFEDMITVFDQVDICKIDDENIYSFVSIPESFAGYTLIKFTVPQNCNRLTTFAVTQKGCRTEEANGMNFDLNDYTRRVDIGFCRVKNAKNLELSNLNPSNFEIINHGEQEMSPYALRDTYVEFQYFKAGTYFMYVDIQWNGKSQDKTFCVNCYSPSEIIFEGDQSTYVEMQTAGLMTGILETY